MHELIRENWDTGEVPLAYIRDGDDRSKLDAIGIDVKEHGAGYRSIHYVFKSRPFDRELAFEVQTRTLFEEGWSEIDHRVRYPNFSDDPLIEYILQTFNRIAGSADEIGGFVIGLSESLISNRAKFASVQREKDEAFASLEQTLVKLEELENRGAESEETIKTLRSQIKKLKMDSESSPAWLTPVRSVADMRKMGVLWDGLRETQDIDSIPPPYRGIIKNLKRNK